MVCLLLHLRQRRLHGSSSKNQQVMCAWGKDKPVFGASSQRQVGCRASWRNPFGQPSQEACRLWWRDRWRFLGGIVPIRIPFETPHRPLLPTPRCNLVSRTHRSFVVYSGSTHSSNNFYPIVGRPLTWQSPWFSAGPGSLDTKGIGGQAVVPTVVPACRKWCGVLVVGSTYPGGVSDHAVPGLSETQQGVCRL